MGLRHVHRLQRGRASRWASSLALTLCGLCGACKSTPPLAAPEPPASARATSPSPQVKSSGPARPAAPTFSPGPLRVDPAFSAVVSGWAGISMFENLISSGFSADSRLFANCHVARQKVLTKACDLIDADHHVAKRVVSTKDYGDGHSARHDPVLQKVLGPLGVPAPEGTWRYSRDLAVTWNRPSDKKLTVSLREATTRVETQIARFVRTDRMRLLPDRMVLSPDGRRLAVVVYVIGGPPLSTDAQLIEVDRAASRAYARAASVARARGDARRAQELAAESHAARSRP